MGARESFKDFQVFNNALTEYYANNENF